jgi:hypothetical protein
LQSPLKVFLTVSLWFPHPKKLFMWFCSWMCHAIRAAYIPIECTLVRPPLPAFNGNCTDPAPPAYSHRVPDLWLRDIDRQTWIKHTKGYYQSVLCLKLTVHLLNWSEFSENVWCFRAKKADISVLYGLKLIRLVIIQA